MKGYVDEDLRALLEVNVGAKSGSEKFVVLVWVDTAFNGGLVLPRNEIERLELKAYSSTPAILADGQHVELPTYTMYLDWFGNEYRTQVVASDAAHPLLGTSLLKGRDLEVSYRKSAVTLQ